MQDAIRLWSNNFEKYSLNEKFSEFCSETCLATLEKQRVMFHQLMEALIADEYIHVIQDGLSIELLVMMTPHRQARFTPEQLNWEYNEEKDRTAICQLWCPLARPPADCSIKAPYAQCAGRSASAVSLNSLQSVSALWVDSQAQSRSALVLFPLLRIEPSTDARPGG